MKIAEGSNGEMEIISKPKEGKVFIHQSEDILMIYIDDIPELIKELERIIRNEN